MAIKNRYWKNTVGVPAEVLIGSAVAYTDSTTWQDFVDNAPNGEIAVVKESDLSIYDGTGAATTTDKLFIAVKRINADGKTVVEKSSTFSRSAVTARKQAYVAPVKQVSTVVTTSGTPAAGDVFSLTIIETTPGNQPFPTYEYEVVAAASETFTQVVTRLVAVINADTGTNKNRDKIVSASVVSTDNIQLTALDYGVSFRIAAQGKFQTYGVSFTYGTPMKIGSGTPSEVAELEAAGDIRKGVTTNYPMAGTVPAEYGKPDSLVVSTNTYNIYSFIGYRNEDSPLPKAVTTYKHNLFVAIPSNGTNPVTAVDTIFGL